MDNNVRSSTIQIEELTEAIKGLEAVEKEVKESGYVSKSKIEGFINRLEPFIIDYAKIPKKYNRLKKRPKAVEVSDIKAFLEYALDELGSLSQIL